MRLAGEPYEHYVVEVSEDLVHWDALVTTQASSTGTIVLTQPLAGSGQQCCRARVAPRAGER